MLKNMRIGVRLGLGFSMVMVLLLIMLATGINAVRTVDGHLERIVRVNNAKIHLANSALQSISVILNSMQNMMISEDRGAMQDEAKKIDASREEYQAAVEKLEKLEISMTCEAFREIQGIAA